MLYLVPVQLCDVVEDLVHNTRYALKWQLGFELY